MMIEAAIAERSEMMFMTRMTFSTTYPAPARDLPKMAILISSLNR